MLVRDWDLPHWSGYDDLPDLHVISLEEARDAALRRRGRDLVGDDVRAVHRAARERYAYFVQSLEDRFYRARRAPSASARR